MPQQIVYILCFTVILLYLELLFFAINSKRLGPKVTMIGHMTTEALKFSPFFIIFVIAFGVAQYSTLFPYKNGFSLEVLEETLSVPFYQIFGENSLEVVTERNETCPERLVGKKCPRTNPFTTLLVAVYVMFMAVLIMNLLIADFSYIFDTVTEHADGIWKRKRFYVTKSFHHQFILPWPLGVPFEFINYIRNKIDQQKPKKYQKELPEKVVHLLEMRYMLEDHCREAILLKRKAEEQTTLSALLTQMNSELNHLDSFKESERFVRQQPIRYVPETFEDQFPGKIDFRT
ncbi:unnamed protein product [Dibothriocephalus latus]|uniref:Ion transport domain-containing protein n=1 Tax=Dibothriocephalus latus TaxID=60516 RepID=A0A3P7LHA8_DIBLA|nr:unnamed protein product [Dibothriocephalus latus]